MREVVVTTGARLHFGLFDLIAGRQFGGIGMMIDSPGVSICVQAAETTSISAPVEIANRVDMLVTRFREAFPTPAAMVQVRSFIPSHNGLGSGTQLAVALGSALAELGNFECSAASIAIATGRGRRSAIGIHGFESGGFFVDSGHAPGDAVGQIAKRIAVPETWRIVLITPADCEGLSGQNELDAFGQLPAMPEETNAELRRCVFEELCPALETNNFTAFATGLDRFGQTIGEYFAPVQGGVFRSGKARELAARLRHSGTPAVVQSSWGPTVCAFAESETAARKIAQATTLTTHIARPLNVGAAIDVRKFG
jgi:beta-RFAP synthase